MSFEWYTVLGGVGRPRFLICGDELVDNNSFEANINGWAGSPSYVNITRVEDDVTFWGDYSCQIEDMGAQVSRSKARYAIETSVALGGRSFAVSFYARAAVAATCSMDLICLDESLSAQEFVVGTPYSHYLGIFSFVAAAETSFDLNIFAVAGGSYANTLFIDKISCREVTKDVYTQFPYLPNESSPEYEDTLLSSARLVDGSLKEYSQGWEARISVQYEYLDRTAEYYRMLLSEASFVWMQLHDDYAYWLAVKWDKNFEQEYFGGVMAGHVGKLRFKSIYLLERKPLDIS